MSEDVRGNQRFLKLANPTIFTEIPHYVPVKGFLLYSSLHLSLSLSLSLFTALLALRDFS